MNGVDADSAPTCRDFRGVYRGEQGAGAKVLLRAGAGGVTGLPVKSSFTTMGGEFLSDVIFVRSSAALHLVIGRLEKRLYRRSTRSAASDRDCLCSRVRAGRSRAVHADRSDFCQRS